LINKYVDSKPIIEQINELQKLARETVDNGEPISKNFQVSNLFVNSLLEGISKDFRV